MLDLKTIRTITLDIADTYADGAIQDQAADLILKLLSQNYQIYVFTSNPKRSLAFEDFEPPGLQYLREPMPPAPELAGRLTDLVAPSNLWVTDDAELCLWLIGNDLPLATRKAPPAPGAHRLLRYHSLGELASALDPTSRVWLEIGQRLDEAGANAGGVACGRVIGIGGPPQGGQPDFALGLKRFLESQGHALVELLDFSALGLGSTADAAAAATGTEREVDPAAEQWIVAQLGRIKGGQSVYHESLPEGIPKAFEPHLPLFWPPESIIVALGEMILAPPLMGLFDLTVLLENTPDETARRVYEIAEQGFDPKFTEQYVAHEGKAYVRYLDQHAVRERATFRVDSNTPGAYFLVGTEFSGVRDSSS